MKRSIMLAIITIIGACFSAYAQDMKVKGNFTVFMPGVFPVAKFKVDYQANTTSIYTPLNFGTQLNYQGINLYSSTYGIGVQNSDLYMRTDGEIFWYKGGTYDSHFGSPGGGTQLMRLGNQGDLIVTGSIETMKSLTIDGGMDLAEPFTMSTEKLPEGTIVIIDDKNPGKLKRSEFAYDTRVAGIISGANGIKPGISLRQDGVVDGGQNVALSGRVYLYANASNGAIKPGDLLTTSDTPGYAMKVTDHDRAKGAVIGKAMSALQEGNGMVLVLVTLQ
ncbi:MAG: hypothetical protein ACHQQQ_13230 [Bacteroidota bacterium]